MRMRRFSETAYELSSRLEGLATQGRIPRAAKMLYRKNQGHGLAQGKISCGKVAILINHASVAPLLEAEAETKLIEQLTVFVVLGPTHSQPGSEFVIRLMGAALDLDQDPDDPFQSSRIASGHITLLIAGVAGKHKCFEPLRPPTGGPR